MSADFRVLAQTRLREAAALLGAGEPSGAYYLAGYAVECGLKAVITRDVTAYALPEKDEFKVLTDAYIHDLNKLVKLAGLTQTLDGEVSSNNTFRNYWLVAKDWRESSRYQIWSNSQAREIVTAVEDPADGVLRWIQLHW